MDSNLVSYYATLNRDTSVMQDWLQADFGRTVGVAAVTVTCPAHPNYRNSNSDIQVRFLEVSLLHAQ